MNENSFYRDTAKIITKKYRSLKKEIEYGYRMVNKDHTLDDGVEFVYYVEKVIHSLPDDYERIILNEFLNKKTPKWWMESYSKSTFYRLKAKAIKEFVDCFKV